MVCYASPPVLCAMNKEKLKELDKLYATTTTGNWVSYIEGRDHDSSSSFIKTGGSDIELTGAKQEDQDFIALVHNFYPELRKHQDEIDLVGLVTDALNKSIAILRENGCINDLKLSKQYYAGSDLYNRVTEAIEVSIDAFQANK